MNEEIKEILNTIECWKNGDYVLAYSFNYDKAGNQNNKILNYITNLQEENQKLNKIIDEIEKEIWKIRQLTFTKYNSNEWNNCLSFNDDILPIINKLTELKKEVE